MLTILYALTFISFGAVVLTLIMGAVAMGGKDKGDRMKSNRWMMRRITAQAIAIILLILTLYVRKQSGG